MRSVIRKVCLDAITSYFQKHKLTESSSDERVCMCHDSTNQSRLVTVYTSCFDSQSLCILYLWVSYVSRFKQRLFS
jgi:hypothetical protein